MIKPLNLDYSLGSDSLYNSDDFNGVLLTDRDKIQLRAHSSFTYSGVGNYLLADVTSDEIETINCEDYYVNRTKLVAPLVNNQDLLEYAASHIGNNVIIHSKFISGVVESICVNGDNIDIIVWTVTKTKLVASRKLKPQYFQFVLIDNSEADNTIGELPVSYVTQTSKEATYGYSRVVYNREMTYEVAFSPKKFRISILDDKFLSADMIYILLGGHTILMKGSSNANIQEQVGTVVLNDLKLARLAFIMSSDKKSLVYRRKSSTIDIKSTFI